MARQTAAMVAAFAAGAVMIGATSARAQCGGAGLHAGHADYAGPTGVQGSHESAAYRSPGIAAALSLTPLPVDFGNLYAENIGWGITYTTLELGLMAPMMFLAVDHGMHANTSNSWSTTDRNWMIGLVSGYVLVKVASGLHAAHNAKVFNQEHAGRFSAAIVPSSGGAAAVAALRF